MKNYTKAEIRKAILASNGTATSVAKMLYPPCTCHTAQKYVKRYPDLQALLNEHSELLLDAAEDVLTDNLTSPNDMVRQRAAEFIATRVGRKKYGNELTDNGNNQLFNILAALSKRAEED